MEFFKAAFSALSSAAGNPLVIVGFLSVIASWTALELKSRRSKQLLDRLGSLSEDDRLEAIKQEFGNIPAPAQMTPEHWLKQRMYSINLKKYLITAALILLITAITSWTYIENKKIVRNSNSNNSKDKIAQVNIDQRIVELKRILDDRSEKINIKLSKSRGSNKIQKELAFFNVLHKRHLKALEDKNFIHAHELLKEIHKLLLEIEVGLENGEKDTYNSGFLVNLYSFPVLISFYNDKLGNIGEVDRNADIKDIVPKIDESEKFIKSSLPPVLKTVQADSAVDFTLPPTDEKQASVVVDDLGDGTRNVTIPLQTGHNLISIPLDLKEQNPKIVLSSIVKEYKMIWQYKDGRWHCYDNNKPGLSDLARITHMSGYWIEVTDPCSLVVTGPRCEKASDIELREGWNLVGFCVEEPFKIQKILHAYSSQIKSIYSPKTSVLDQKKAEWLVFRFKNDHENTLEYIRPGKGYWIEATAPFLLLIK